jgi:DNA-binding NtrC family response regulator
MLPPPLNAISPLPPTMGPATPKHTGVVGSTASQITSSSDHESAGNQDMAHLAGKIRPMADIEREASESAIAQYDGDSRKSATLLGIFSPTIYLKKAVWNGS